MAFDPKISAVGIVTLIVTLLGLALAFQMGKEVAANNYKFLAVIFGGGVVMLVVFTLQRHYWLLVPLCWALGGRLNWLPVPFSVQELAVFAAFGLYCVNSAMKRTGQARPTVNYLDFIILFNLAIIVEIWIRNPVGLAFMGSDRVGGKPYLTVAVGFMAFIVLRRSLSDPKLAYAFPLILLGPSIIVSILGTLTYVFPSLTPIIYPLYSGIDISSYMAEEYGGGGAATTIQEGRFQTLGQLGSMMIMALIAYQSPRKVMSPMAMGKFAILVAGLFFIGLAGFRSGFIQCAVTIIIASYFWDRGIGVVQMIFLGLISLTLLIALQGAVDLPKSMQRTLSFLPGAWNDSVKRDASGSSDWRFEMWETALTTDRYIKNKLLGDGFGFSKEDYQIMLSGGLGGQGFVGGEANKESFMIQGSYHSGPVSAIRFAGVLGLLTLLALQLALGFYSYGLMRRAWNTPLRPLAILLTLECVYRPFHFIFIFGEYRADLPSAFYQAGMLKMLENSLNLYHHTNVASDPIVNSNNASDSYSLSHV